MTRPLLRATRRVPAAPGRALLRSRAAVLAGLTSCAALLAGCGSGFDAQTNQVQYPGDGTNVTSGSLKVLNAVIVAGSSGSTVTMTIANTANANALTPDIAARAVTLAGVASGDAQASISGPTKVAAQSTLQVGGSSGTTAQFSGASFEPGSYVPLTVQLDPSQSLSLTVPVVAEAGYYATATPTAAPSS
ncbi:hypothetical protein CLV35_0395 [Motilibacter peucedani]|uniref:Copper(I)-binding protein n=1 Tax=Motilibacter peucedani TaxID=598650 RepID=A0A420XT82_9ACTN|nr:hypothetical protein [Motilibacter peucedani]RKS79977.1 hypothetical protein CLV35_0395 [Motilibacter peucedani]